FVHPAGPHAEDVAVPQRAALGVQRLGDVSGGEGDPVERVVAGAGPRAGQADEPPPADDPGWRPVMDAERLQVGLGLAAPAAVPAIRPGTDVPQPVPLARALQGKTVAIVVPAPRAPP